MFKRSLTNQNGFSMVEALVAITVLMIGVIGPLTLLANAISNANYAKNQITAFFLAQEGQELVINARNNNRLENPPKISADPDSSTNNGLYWLGGNGLRQCIPGGSFNLCYGDASKADQAAEDKFVGCTDDICPDLIINSDGYFGYASDPYNPESGTKTIFNRTIKIEPFNEGGLVNSAKVTVTVTWHEKALTRQVVLESIIYR